MRYFADLGFSCPSDRDAADFLLDIGTATQARYRTRSILNVSDRGGRHPKTGAGFGAIFRQTTQLSYSSSTSGIYVASSQFMDTAPEFHHGFLQSTWRVMKRELVLMSRNSVFIKGRAVMIVIMGLLYSNIFYQFDPKKAQVVMGVTFSGTLFILLGQVSQISGNMAIREIFYKQHRSNFYRASSLVVSAAISRIPLALVESVVFGGLLYWMCGFSGNTGSFIAFEVLIFLMSIATGSWYYFLCAALPNVNITIPVTLVLLLLSVMFGGFVIPKNQIPDYLEWLYWLTPMSWCVRSIMMNQYRSPELSVCNFEGVNYCERFHVTSAGE